MLKRRLAVWGTGAVLVITALTAVIAAVAVPFWIDYRFGVGVAFIVSARTGAVVISDQLAAEGHLWAYHPAFHWTVRILFTAVGMLLCVWGLIRRFGMSAHPTH